MRGTKWNSDVNYSNKDCKFASRVYRKYDIIVGDVVHLVLYSKAFKYLATVKCMHLISQDGYHHLHTSFQLQATTDQSQGEETEGIMEETSL